MGAASLSIQYDKGYLLSELFFRERQQQLEELTKELGRIQDEADGLRIKLKAYKNNKVYIWYKYIHCFGLSGLWLAICSHKAS